MFPTRSALVLSLLLAGCSDVPRVPHGTGESPPSKDYQATYQEWYADRASPRGIVNWEIYEDARRMEDALDIGPPPGSFWTYIGPTNWGVWNKKGQGPAPVNGRVNMLAYDPQEPDQIHYAATAAGGLWKTWNGGQTWFPLSDRWDELFTSSVAVDPVDPDNVYVGTGDYPGGKGIGVGLMISHDGGLNWTQHKGKLDGQRITDILVDPEFPELITVAASFGTDPSFVYLSQDGGQSFDKVISTYDVWTDLAMSLPYKGSSGILTRHSYAVGLGPGSGTERTDLFHSDTRGQTWTERTLPFAAAEEAGVAVAASATNPHTVYVAGTTSRKVYMSPDAGISWFDITAGLPSDADTWGQGNYSFRLHSFVIPSRAGDKDGLLLARVDLFAWDGNTWNAIGGDYDPNDPIHVDVHAFASHPIDPSLMLVSTDGGVHRFEYDPGLNDGTFTQRSARLGCALVSKLAVHPSIQDWVLGGTQDNGTAACGGNKEQWYSVRPGDTGFCAISRIHPGYQYVPYANQLGRGNGNTGKIAFTDDHWNSWRKLQIDVTGEIRFRHGTPVRIDPKDFKSLYFAGHFLYRYDAIQDQAVRVSNQDLAAVGGTGAWVSNFDVGSGGQRIVTGSNKGEIWTSANAGSSWRRIDDAPLPANTAIEVISIDPFNNRRVLVAYTGTYNTKANLYECKDVDQDPAVWKNVTGTFPDSLMPVGPITAIARHPTSPVDHWFVGTDEGCYYTEDAGKHWTNFGNPLGLPNVPVTDLQVARTRKLLYASTWGRGIWRIPLPVVPFGQLKLK